MIRVLTESHTLERNNMPTQPLWQQQKQAIESELQERITKFKANVKRRKAMQPLFAAGVQPLTLMAQGDSWFDYPLPFPTHSDVIAHLNAMPISPEILSLAHHGEAAEDMMGVSKYERLKAALMDNSTGQQFDAILFSGGGNDLAGDQFALWLKDAARVANNPAQGLDQEMLSAIMQVVTGSYRRLIALRDAVQASYAPGSKLPLFVHSYDFAIPTGIGVCTAGPWLQPGLTERGWDTPNGTTIVRQMLTAFATALDQLATQTPDFIHVHTQGTLTAPQWANELHPTPEGFAAISAQFVQALRTRFPGRI